MLTFISSIVDDCPASCPDAAAPIKTCDNTASTPEVCTGAAGDCAVKADATASTAKCYGELINCLCILYLLMFHYLLHICEIIVLQ